VGISQEDMASVCVQFQPGTHSKRWFWEELRFSRKLTSTFKTQAILIKLSLTVHTYTSSIICIRIGGQSLSLPRYSTLLYTLPYVSHSCHPKNYIHYAVGLYIVWQQLYAESSGSTIPWSDTSSRWSSYACKAVGLQ